MNKSFQVEHKGKLSWRVVRQAPTDPQYQVGSRIPGLGKVVAVQNLGSTIQPTAKSAAEYAAARVEPYAGVEINLDALFTQEAK